MRTLPSTSKPPVGAMVYWFYKEYLGVTPDRHVYSRFSNPKNEKSLVPILVPHKHQEEGGDEFEVEAYSVLDCAELVYYLEDEGVTVDTLGIITIPGLMFAYVNRNKLESAKRQLESTIRFLKGDNDNGNGQGERGFDAPSGW